MAGLVLLFFAYKFATGLMQLLIARMHGPEAIDVSIRGVGRWAGGSVGGEFGLAASIVTFTFCLFVARPVGYHRRDAIWAAIPSIVAPYFIMVISWRFLHLRHDRYWTMPTDKDFLAYEPRARKEMKL